MSEEFLVQLSSFYCVCLIPCDKWLKWNNEFITTINHETNMNTMQYGIGWSSTFNHTLPNIEHKWKTKQQTLLLWATSRIFFCKSKFWLIMLILVNRVMTNILYAYNQDNTDEVVIIIPLLFSLKNRPANESTQISHSTQYTCRISIQSIITMNT